MIVMAVGIDDHSEAFMKILFIAREFPKTSETFVLAQVNGLLERGHDVTVLSLKNPVTPPSQYGLGKRVVSLGYHANVFDSALKMVSCTFSGGFSPSFLRYMNRADSPLAPSFFPPYNSGLLQNADAVLVHFGDLAQRCAFLFDNLGIKTPLAVVFHGVDVARHLPALPESERQRLWNVMSLGLPVSDFWRRRLISLGCPEDKLRVHHMGVDPGHFTFRERISNTALRFLSVCRLVEKKGIDTALEALTISLEKNPGFEFSYDIIGDGPLQGALEKQVQSLGIENRVTFHGRKYPAEAQKYFEDADAYLLSSRTAVNGDMEGIPVSLMEAMASGLPVVSSVHSGIPELITDHDSGLLVAEGDAKGLADAILELAGSSEFRAQMAKNARAVIERDFNHEHLMSDLESVFADMIAEKDRQS